MGKLLGSQDLIEGRVSRWLNKICTKFFGSSLYGFSALCLAFLTQLCYFWYGLKDLFPLHKLDDKVVPGTSQAVEGMWIRLGGVYMTPGQLLPQSEFTLVPSHGSIFFYMIPPQISCWHKSPRREFTPVLVPGREFHSGTKSRNGIM